MKKLICLTVWMLILVAVLSVVSGKAEAISDEEMLIKSTQEVRNFMETQREIMRTTAEAFANLECPDYWQDREDVKVFFERVFIQEGKIDEEWFSLLSEKLREIGGDSVKMEITNEVELKLVAAGIPHKVIRVTNSNKGSTTYVLTPTTKVGCVELKKISYSLL